MDCKWSKEVKGKKIASYLLQKSYWKNVLYSLKLTSPLVKDLRIVDEEKKLPMVTFMRPWIKLRKLLPKASGIKKRIMKWHFKFLNA